MAIRGFGAGIRDFIDGIPKLEGTYHHSLRKCQAPGVLLDIICPTGGRVPGTFGAAEQFSDVGPLFSDVSGKLSDVGAQFSDVEPIYSD